MTAPSPTADGASTVADTLREELRWIALFADMRSKDDSKTFARVNRGALRTIAERAAEAIRRAESAQ